MANRKGQLQVSSAKDGAVIDEINRLQDEIGDQLAGGAKTLLDKAIRIGELLTSQKAKTKRGDWKDWVEANLKFTRQTADNYMKCFRNRATLKAQMILHPTVAYKLLTTGNTPHVSRNSGENEWYTPPEIIQSARDVMGSIDVDPASSNKDNETVQAETFFTKKEDGLQQSWGKQSNVWMNPPYEQPACSDFCRALAAKVKSGEVKQAIVLVNNATETEWFLSIKNSATHVVFPQKRLKFLDKKGDPVGAPLQGQAIIYIGPNGPPFLKRFSKLG